MKLTVDEINLLLSGIAARNDVLKRERHLYSPCSSGNYYDKCLKSNDDLYNRLLIERERVSNEE